MAIPPKDAGYSQRRQLGIQHQQVSKPKDMPGLVLRSVHPTDAPLAPVVAGPGVVGMHALWFVPLWVIIGKLAASKGQ